MNADYISYEALVAARKAAEWSYWSMIGTCISAIATLAAAVIGYLALSGWRKQEEAKELKDFRVAAYSYGNALIFSPQYIHVINNEQDSNAARGVYDEIQKLYLTALAMHDFKSRSNASKIFNDISEIHKKYTKSEITNMEAHKAVMHIRQTEPLLGICG